MSIRATVRVTGAAKNTVTKLLVDLGAACSDYLDGAMSGLDCRRLQCDEIWAFCYSKAKNVPEDKRDQFGYGDVWTFTAIDADTKLVPSFLVAQRSYSYEDAEVFVRDLASRLRNRVQLTTDGLHAYLVAVGEAFGGEIDFAQLRKIYGKDPKADGRYSPPKCVRPETYVRAGDPDPRHVSTSYVERQNLTMPVGMRRFTRLTNAFSKRVENLTAAVALHFMHYNFCRPHQSLGRKTTPAMAAGISDHVWTLREIAGLLDSKLTHYRIYESHEAHFCDSRRACLSRRAHQGR
jgi:IS1 family transposase